MLGKRNLASKRVANEVYEMGSSSRDENRDVVDFVTTLPPSEHIIQITIYNI